MEDRIEISIENLYKLINFSKSYTSGNSPEKCFLTFKEKYLEPREGTRTFQTTDGVYLYLNDRYYTVWRVGSDDRIEPNKIYGPFNFDTIPDNVWEGCLFFSNKASAVRYLKSVERFAVTKFTRNRLESEGRDFVIYGDVKYPTTSNSYYYEFDNEAIPVTYQSMITLGECYNSGHFTIGEIEIRKTGQRIGVGDVVRYHGESREVSRISFSTIGHLIVNFSNCSGNASSCITKEGECTLEDILLVRKKDERRLLFKTEDGVDVYEKDGQTIWQLDTTTYNWTQMTRDTNIIVINSTFPINPNIKYFANAERLKEYRYHNQPILLTKASLEKLILNSIEIYNKVNSKEHQSKQK